MNAIIRLALVPMFLFIGCLNVAHAQRVIDENGAGNCIFGPEKLPFQKEGSAPYKRVTDTFKPEQDIYARCYYNGTLNSHKKHGKLFNSMRSEGYYYGVMSWHQPLPNGKILSHGRLKKLGERMRFSVGKTGDWDQQSMRFGKKDCGVKVENKDVAKTGAYPSRCINYAKMARYMEKKKGLSPQPKSKFCMEILLVYANKKRKRWVSDHWVYEDIKDYRKMAGGCFFIEH